MNYILDGHEAIEEPDLLTWAAWFEHDDRQVKITKIEQRLDDGACIFTDVSTVFLGISYSFGDGEPELFETMVFGGKLDEEMDRCATWEAAEKMHELMCEKVRSAK